MAKKHKTAAEKHAETAATFNADQQQEAANREAAKIKTWSVEEGQAVTTSPEATDGKGNPIPKAVDGPPFYATEYVFEREGGNRKVIYTPVGAPVPAMPAGYCRLANPPLKFPFETAEARAKAIG
ncbi:MAG TPA: hypothetical protein VEA69_16710 [Tepidisphaeraceae bacterium]|nr:hypothetical protein [Tepidisphaeraceae bacterium]